MILIHKKMRPAFLPAANGCFIVFIIHETVWQLLYFL